MKTTACLLFILTQLSYSPLNAQNNTRINERLGWIKRLCDSRSFKPEHADLFYNVASLYALKDDKDSSFHYLFKAINLCPDSINTCKEIYSADILGDVCFRAMHSDSRWKLFEKRIKAGFSRLNPDVTHPGLAYQLMVARGADQTVRFYNPYFNDKQRSAIARLNIDSSNLAFIIRLITENGFPTIPMVGAPASHAAFLLSQHADKDLSFQKKVLALMNQSIKAVDKADIAYLTDRIMVAEKGTQLYGTQFISVKDRILYPIQDSATVNSRRKQMGLSTLKEYLNSFYSPD